ncbi:MAG: hypothetical protein H7331_09505 [Bacteroidia bacterium]|nr:hypothetical protein [Bacteroidia bacterium]
MKTNLKIVGLVLVVTSLFACEKEYSCLCYDETSDPKSFTIKDTHRNAKRTCEKMSNNTKTCKLLK